MKTIITTVMLSMSFLLTGGCSSSKRAADDAAQQSSQVETGVIQSPGKILGGQEASALPQAIIYKTNGNFNDNVPITLSADRKEIVSYPAPTDITPSSAPIALAEGYLLDRRGIGENTAFTQYTYQSYSALKQAPSLKTLKESIIAGAEIVEIIRLPMTLNEAVNDTTRCNTIITNGLPDCDILLHRHAIQLTPQ